MWLPIKKALYRIGNRDLITGVVIAVRWRKLTLRSTARQRQEERQEEAGRESIGHSYPNCTGRATHWSHDRAVIFEN